MIELTGFIISLFINGLHHVAQNIELFRIKASLTIWSAQKAKKKFMVPTLKYHSTIRYMIFRCQILLVLLSKQ